MGFNDWHRRGRGIPTPSMGGIFTPNRVSIPQRSNDRIWNNINSNKTCTCLKCNSYDPDKCEDCKKFKRYVLSHAPSVGDASCYLEELTKYHKDRNSDLFSWEDYDKS